MPPPFTNNMSFNNRLAKIALITEQTVFLEVRTRSVAQERKNERQKPERLTSDGKLYQSLKRQHSNTNETRVVRHTVIPRPVASIHNVLIGF